MHAAGPLQALSAHLPADNSAQAAHTEEILKQLRQMQEQVGCMHRCSVNILGCKCIWITDYCDSE